MRPSFCADDWGLSPGINAGILEFAKRGWLQSVSCLANSAYLEHRLVELIKYGQNGLSISLHLNFTHGLPVAPAGAVATLIDARTGKFHAHRKFLLRSYLGRLDSSQIQIEYRAQLGKLKSLGLAAQGLDGHHHVHLLGAVDRALKGLLAKDGIKHIRVLRDPSHFLTFWQGLWKRGPDGSLSECLYLKANDLRSRQSLIAKLNRGLPLLVHPAQFNDFSQARMDDSLREFRVHQFDKITEYLA